MQGSMFQSIARRCPMVLAALWLAACAGPAAPPPGEVTAAMIAQPPDAEWLSYGRDSSEQRFSPLTRINDGNVGTLGLAWYADLDTARGQEATPLLHDGVLFVSTAWSMVKAYDAASGALKWSYDPKVPRETLQRACCDAVNRGVALYGDRLFVGTLDGRLVALDQKSGRQIWSRVVVPNSEDYAITGAPRVAQGLVLIGSGGSEYRARGFVAAFDATTGAEQWRFHTVPGDPARGFENEAMAAAAKTWSGQWWKLGGGGTVWDSITYDPVTHLVLFGTGNPEPWNPAPTGRAGDNLYTASIVAVHAESGQYAWHFQETPEDRWDLDSNAQITIADLSIGGKPRHVALHAPKNGYFYVLDARSGQFISATPFAPQNWTTGVDSTTGRALINPEARYDQSGKPFVGLPGAAGAHSWHPMSFSPKTGLVYIPANIAGFPYAAATHWQPSAIGYQTAQDSAAIAMPADTTVRNQILGATVGALIAWDPVARREVWRVPYAGPWNGGTLATAGNLVFQGDAAGQFSAYSADRGRKLWSYPVQSGVIAAPITYALNGEQYVAILVGWGGVWDVAPGVLAHKSGAIRNISRLVVFKLGGSGALPSPPPLQRLPLDPPPFRGKPEQATHGAQVYGRYCAHCHGDAAVAGALNPDLRRSAMLNDRNAVKAVVIDGVLSHNGMVSFRSALSADDAEAARQYLIKRANEDRALGER